MTAMQKLENLGYRFRLEGDRVLVQHFGTAPEEASALLEALDREEVRRTLQDRAAGFSVAPDGVLWAYGDDVLPTARKLRAALDTGDLWDVRVIYHRKTWAAEFHFQSADWRLP